MGTDRTRPGSICPAPDYNVLRTPLLPEGDSIMEKKAKTTLFIFFFSLALLGGFSIFSLAGQDHHADGEHRKREGHGVHRKRCFKSLPNQDYKTTCGECHLAYPPELLPTASWKKIVNQLEDHFGEQVPVNSQSKKSISRYLMENGADRSSCKKSARIMKSLKGKTPLRITEIPYILDEHREIPLKALQQKGIGSLSNCLACHKTADQGLFRKSDYSFQKLQRPAYGRMG
jgi:hypothetical protein